MARLNGAAIGFETISQMPLRTRAFWTIKTDPVMFRESAFRFSASRLAGMIELALEAYDWGTNSAHYFNAFCSYAIYPKLTPQCMSDIIDTKDIGTHARFALD